jgi:hypothetical protein
MAARLSISREEEFAMIGLLALVAAALFAGAAVYGALVLIANWPYTLLIIKPVNDELLASDPTTAGDEVRRKLRRWGAACGANGSRAGSRRDLPLRAICLR